MLVGTFWEDLARLVRRNESDILPSLTVTCQDAMIYAKGPSEEYDRIADVSGDDGWSWNALQPFMYHVSASCMFAELVLKRRRTSNTLHNGTTSTRRGCMNRLLMALARSSPGLPQSPKTLTTRFLKQSISCLKSNSTWITTLETGLAGVGGDCYPCC
jgi:hypothetical protein